MVYFTYFIYKQKNLIEFLNTAIILFPKSENRGKNTKDSLFPALQNVF